MPACEVLERSWDLLCPSVQTLQIAMTIGVTSALAEHSFSSLKSLKTHLQSTMSQERLNISLLHIERDLSKKFWDNLNNIILIFADAHTNSRVPLNIDGGNMGTRGA